MKKYFYYNFHDFLNEALAFAPDYKKGNIDQLIKTLKIVNVEGLGKEPGEMTSMVELEEIASVGIGKIAKNIIDGQVYDYIKDDVQDFDKKTVILRTGPIVIKDREGIHNTVEILLNNKRGNEIIFLISNGRLRSVRPIESKWGDVMLIGKYKASQTKLKGNADEPKEISPEEHDIEIKKRFKKFKEEQEMASQEEPAFANIISNPLLGLGESNPEIKEEDDSVVVVHIKDENTIGGEYIIKPTGLEKPIEPNKPTRPRIIRSTITKINPEEEGRRKYL